MTGAKPRTFIAVPDTNALWTGSVGAHLCSATFGKDWHAVAAHGDCHLLIPQVVFDERWSQIFRALWRDYRDGCAKLKPVAEAMSGEFAIPELARESLRQRIGAALRRAVDELGSASIRDTPYKAIGEVGLRRIAEAAVWRDAPFKDSDKEQGFRDALILETLNDIVTEHIHVDVALISQDARLIEAAEKLPRPMQNFGVYRSLLEFSQFLDLARTRFAPEFLHGITAIAQEVFQREWLPRLSPASGLDLIRAPEVIIKERASGPLSLPAANESNVASLATILGMPQKDTFELEDTGGITSGRTVLVAVVGQDNFHFQTNVVLRARYRRRFGFGLLGLGGANTEENQRHMGIVHYVAEWSATVNEQQQLSNSAILGIRKLTDWILPPGQEITAGMLSAIAEASELTAK